MYSVNWNRATIRHPDILGSGTVASVTRWQVSLEARWPVGENGGFGARLRLAEAKNGRLSWSYPLFSTGRVLSAQSHTGLRLETLYVKRFEQGVAPAL